MKKLITMILLLAMTLSFSACGNDQGDVPYGMKLASDPETVDYLVYVPEDWAVTVKAGMTMAQVSLADATNMIVTNHSHTNVSEYRDSKNTLIAYLYGADAVKLPSSDVEVDPELYDKDGYRKYDDGLLQVTGSYLNRVYSLFDTETADDGSVKSTFQMIESPSFTTLKKRNGAVAAITFVTAASLTVLRYSRKWFSLTRMRISTTSPSRPLP